MATKINLRSPFYIKATADTGTLSSAVMSLYVYDGDFTSDKGDVKYTIEKTALSGKDYVVFEISELVRDYLDIEFNGTYESSTPPEIDPVRWVESDIVITKTESGTATSTTASKLVDTAGQFTANVKVGDIVSNTTDNTTASVTAVDSNTQLSLSADIMASGEAYVIKQSSASQSGLDTDYIAFDGYGYFEEGVNPELSRTLLQSNKTIFRIDDFNVRVPIFTEDTDSVTFFYKGEEKRIQPISSSTNTNAQIDYVTVSGSDNSDSYRQRVLSNGGTFEDNSLLDDFLNSIDIGLVDELYINSDSGTEIVKIKTFDCSKYEPIKVTFVNKFGALQDFYFVLKSIESTNVKSEQYKRSIFSEASLSYKTYQHQKQLFHTNGNDTITLNTDYIDEENNKVIEELMLSEQTWITRITDEEELILPVMPKTKSVTYKTSVNDKLVQYTIEFDMAFDKINNIR